LSPANRAILLPPYGVYFSTIDDPGIRRVISRTMASKGITRRRSAHPSVSPVSPSVARAGPAAQKVRPVRQGQNPLRAGDLAGERSQGRAGHVTPPR
jgi:hypothetical protein